MTIMFDIILLAMALYILIGGIIGKGKLFNNQNVKEGKEKEFVKYTRIAYIILGSVMFIHSAVSTIQSIMYEFSTEAGEYVATGKLSALSFLTYPTLRTIGLVFFILTILWLVVLIIIMRRFTNPATKGSASNKDNRQAGHILPVDAFEFEEPVDSESEAGKDAAVSEIEE